MSPDEMRSFDLGTEVMGSQVRVRVIDMGVLLLFECFGEFAKAFKASVAIVRNDVAQLRIVTYQIQKV
jgi:hypothetical protein